MWRRTRETDMKTIDVKGVLGLLRKCDFLMAYFPGDQEGVGSYNTLRSFQLIIGQRVDVKAGKKRCGSRHVYHKINFGITSATPLPATYFHEDYGTKKAIVTLFSEALREAAREGRVPQFHARPAEWQPHAEEGETRPAHFTIKGNRAYPATTRPVYVLTVGEAYLYLAEPGFDSATSYGKTASWEIVEFDEPEREVIGYTFELPAVEQRPSV
jgi:hypothetical protein